MMSNADLRTGKSGLFNVLSLQCWIELAESAHIDVVSARLLGVLPKSIFIDLLEERAISDENLAVLDRINAAILQLEAHEIVRFDHCSSAALKYCMAHGLDPLEDREARGMAGGHEMLLLDDLRIMDMADDYPGDALPIFARPWVPARSISGRSFPEEWRVFMSEGQIQGISLYYPQAPLTEEEVDPDTIARLTNHAGRMIERLQEARLTPCHRRYGEQANAGFTLDFLHAEDGRLLLLEGGPASLPFFGAHPCCFS